MGKKYIETSIAAFKSLQSKEMEQTYIGILSALKTIKGGTFEDISKFMKCSPSKVWKRMSELDRKFMLVYRPGDKRPLKSGREGFVWRLTSLGEDVIGANVSVLAGKTIADYSRAIKKASIPISEVKQLF